MKVNLIGATKPVGEYEEHFDNVMDLVAYCAKVSNPKGQLSLESGERLIRYLIKHKHWSPLEMASATIEVETTRDIARQFLRHRSFSFQEFSQRYSDVNDMDESFVIRECRLQDTKNRQNSIDNEDPELARAWAMKQQQLIHETKLTYKWAIENGIAKEQARVILPEGNTVSRLYANGTIRSWIHFIELRTANGTQKEHMDLAHEVAKAISKVFPMAMEFSHMTTAWPEHLLDAECPTCKDGECQCD